MSTFSVRKYDLGSAESTRVSVQLDGGWLKIVESGEQIPLDDLDLELGGHLQDRIKLKCLPSGALLVTEDRGLLAALGESGGQSPVVEKARSALKKLNDLPGARRNYWLKIFAIAAAVVVGAYFSIDILAATLIDRIDPKTEAQLGRLLVSEKGLDSKSADSTRVQRIGTRLAKHLDKNPYELHFSVQDDETVNAFAVPGGYIVVMSGLVKKAENDDELAGIIAHEIGHVVNRDSLKHMAHSLGILMCIGLVTGTGIGGQDSEKIADALALGSRMESLRYGRSQELNADLTGLKLVVRAGYNGEGLIKFFQRLQAEEGARDSKLLEVLSTHPMTSERISRIRNELARLRKPPK